MGTRDRLALSLHWFRGAQDESICTVGVPGLISPVQNLAFSVVFLLKAGHLVGTK